MCAASRSRVAAAAITGRLAVATSFHHATDALWPMFGEMAERGICWMVVSDMGFIGDVVGAIWSISSVPACSLPCPQAVAWRGLRTGGAWMP
ncbi:hypothetical protein [Actimicrobium sp. CCI2.3]|uniref:hypothetical protein n=1 Tax=Actimicrobium sp. CCI2.3 TaxID=3048616 RepID=UPI002AB3C212|nr:hypothetical protein [Actimicrobium sp. CCI2.3]MDY7576665.1 hypothetical protein [Actimicrobium sp. CCI2.3]MEB0023538.1 hypothetical protein [Actimicrobium sp. CCI2.3]